MNNSTLNEAKRRFNKGERKYSYDDLMRMRTEGAIQATSHIIARREESALKSILGRSGILPLHQGCTIKNYIVSNDLQAEARNFAERYIYNFGSNIGSGFIFSGGTGTGKNHLSAAICNSLMSQGKTCLVVTVTELMLNMRKCYSDKAQYSEDEFIKQLINFDLLVLDEIGLQKGSDHEKIILNQVIDQRIGNLKPVGVLTNLDHNSVKAVLGERIFDRLKSNNSQWVPFNWGSYR
tara:strand:+ start:3105 stop:3812 length:708 start_codon:yes stop_codon:yes gene_type:complete